MSDALGFRKKFGILIPSTNTIVEPDYWRMAVPGVTCHTSRIHIHDQDISSNAKLESLLVQIREEILRAIDRVKTAQVDYLVMGMSLETFWDGLQGNKEFVDRLEQYSGLSVASGARACQKALELLRCRRIAVLTPYQEVGDVNVIRYFKDIGIEVVRIEGLRCPTAISIAHVSEDEIRKRLQKIDGPDVDAIIQVGTNLSMLQLADEAERWIGKPVIAINGASWWYALRQNGIKDQLQGCGVLMREY